MTMNNRMTPKEFLLGKDAAKSVTLQQFQKLVGRDELKIVGDPGAMMSGSMAVNIEMSTFDGKQCFFVTISTGFDRKAGYRSLCQVSGFVDFDLYTLEERRIISSKDGRAEDPESGFSSASSTKSSDGRTASKLRDYQNCRTLVHVHAAEEQGDYLN